MRHAELIESELPNLRRYARAVTGCQVSGDAIVDAAIHVPQPAQSVPENRLGLFRCLETHIESLASESGRAVTGEACIAAAPRRALLLTELAGFSVTEAAAVSGRDEADVRQLIDAGRKDAATARPTEVFIIEDEPMIAAHLAEVTRQMGHEVIGTAATAASALRACRQRPPGLLLSDIMLGEDPAGAEAAQQIAAANKIPVVFITAFPQAQLRGEKGEPAYLIEKPFRTETIRTVITQALLNMGQSRGN